jgi:hypothetical protein
MVNTRKKKKQYTFKDNKGWKRVIFELGDWVWVHICKERFPKYWRSKLILRKDGPF